MPKPTIRSWCENCGEFSIANLCRGHYVVDGESVPRVLVYRCDGCIAIVGTPHLSSGRIYAAKIRDQHTTTRDFRIPIEVEDAALNVHSLLGAAPRGDVFALPITIGLRVTRFVAEPDQRWKSFDECKASVRARPVLSDGFMDVLNVLRERWGADSRSQLVRWLIVAAWLSLSKGIGTRPEVVEEVFDLVNDHFDGDVDRAQRWFATPNPLLGGITPIDMIKLGRADRLRDVITETKQGHLP